MNWFLQMSWKLKKNKKFSPFDLYEFVVSFPSREFDSHSETIFPFFLEATVVTFPKACMWGGRGMMPRPV